MWLYRVNAAYTNSGSFRDHVDIERTAIAPSLLWQPAEHTEVLLDLSYVKETQPYDTGLPITDDGKALTKDSAFFNDPDLDGRTNEDYYVGYQLKHTFNSTWSLRNQLQLHRAHNLNEALRPRGVVGNLLTQRYQNEDRTDDEVQFVIDLTGQFATGSIDHTLLIGVDYIDQDSNFDRFRVNAPATVISDNPLVNFTPPANQTPSEDLSETHWSGIYIQDQLSLLDDGRLKVLLGGRFDDVSTKGSSNGTASKDVKDQAFTARGGLLYSLSDDLSIYASASQSFINRNLFAMDASSNVLDPETGVQYEVGVKKSMFNERLFATIAVYEIKKEDVAVFDQDLFNATGQSAYFAGVEQRSRGFELDIAGHLTNQLQIIANYSYTDTEVLANDSDPTKKGERLGGVSPHAARLRLSYEFASSSDLDGFGMGGGIRYVGDSSAQFDNSVTLTDYTVADASVWYRWHEVKVSLNAKNLFNKEYIARANDTAIAHPGAPRMLIGEVSFSF